MPAHVRRSHLTRSLSKRARKMAQKKIHTRPGHHRQSFKMNRSWYIILDVVRWQTARRILFFYFTFHPSDSHHPRPLHRSLKQGCNFSISSINSFRIHIDSALLVTWFFSAEVKQTSTAIGLISPLSSSQTPCQPRLERHIYAITVAISNHLTLPTLLDPSHAYYHNRKNLDLSYIFQQAKQRKILL